MATTVSASITSLIKATFKNATSLSTTFTGAPKKDFERTFNTTETTKCYFNTYTVTTTPTSIDLTSLTDAYGNSISFGTIKHLLVCNNATTGNLTVGGGTNGVFTALPFSLNGYTATGGTSNGSCLNLTANITVDGTHKILTLTASVGSISVDVFIVGI